VNFCPACGVTGVTDITGPVDQVGTRYRTLFGKMSSPTGGDRGRATTAVPDALWQSFLRGGNQALFEPDGNGTWLTQEFWTKGLVSAVMARVFATGSYKGSFQGELNEFARIASAEGRLA
jgi:hypothetical protein